MKVNNKSNGGDYMNKPIRHGEIMLVPVNKVPNKEAVKYSAYILGHSETGHHHVLESKVEFDLIEDDKELYLRLFEPAKLVHKKLADKHRDLTIAPGLYKRYHDTEYDPFEKIIRDVAD